MFVNNETTMDENNLESAVKTPELLVKPGNLCHELLKTFKKPFNSGYCENCFLKGVKWSPDGLCLLTASEDFHLRLFEPTEGNVDDQPVLDYREGGTVYDFAWFPGMTSEDPTTCV